MPSSGHIGLKEQSLERAAPLYKSMSALLDTRGDAYLELPTNEREACVQRRESIRTHSIASGERSDFIARRLRAAQADAS